jgi:hypothetical protein
MASKCLLWLVAGGVSFAAFAYEPLRNVPVPSDPLEPVSGPVRSVADTATRTAMLQLLDRARQSYALRSAGQGFDLTVAFTVNSHGRTAHDGTWQMEDVFNPALGLRWTAQAPSNDSITRIAANGKLYGDDTASYLPLRLQEARSALFNPMPTAESMAHTAIRVSEASFNGKPVTCLLLSSAEQRASTAPGRSWEETEECIDPQSGLLMMHSQVPGRYFAYDYTNAVRLGAHTLARRVKVTEGGATVTEISVVGLSELAAPDPNLFVPSKRMQEQGRAIGTLAAQKITRVVGSGDDVTDVVCVFGLVTPTGELVEAHSLQPWNPHSEAAVASVKQMSFQRPAPVGQAPAQRFVFVIEKFAGQ